MIKHLKYLLAFVLLLIISNNFFVAEAADSKAIGIIDISGQDIEGTFNTENYELTINQFNKSGEINLYDPNDSENITLRVRSIVVDGPSEIPERAFFGFKNVTSVSSNTVSTLGSSCFMETDVRKINFMSDFPNVLNVSDYAFKGCTGLESVNFGNVQSIGNGAFSGCTSLSIVSSMSSVRTIGKDAFKGCVGLSRVDLRSVVDIGDSAFWGCDNLINIQGLDNVEHIGKYAFKDCSLLGMTSIINGNCSIEEGAFVNAIDKRSSSNYISFRGSSINIGIDAFRNSGINQIDSNGASCVIDSGAFLESNIATFSDADGVTSIGANAFKDCIKLKEFTPSANLTELSDGSFYGTSNLISEWDRHGLDRIPDMCFYDSGIPYLDFTTIDYIGDSAFYNSDISGFNEIRCSYIGRSAFGNTSSRSSVDLCTIVSSNVGEGAFSNSSMLPDNIVFEDRDGHGSFGDSIFENCSGVKKIELINFTSIPNYFCRDVDTLEEIMIDGSNPDIGNEAFNRCNNLKEVKSGSGCASIKASGEFCFNSCESLISIPALHGSTGTKAFGGCTSIESVDLRNVTSVGQQSFYGCSGLTEILWLDGNCDNYEAFYVDTPTNTEIKDAVVGSIDIEEFENATNRVIAWHSINMTVSYNGHRVFVRDDGTRVLPDLSLFNVLVDEVCVSPWSDKVEQSGPVPSEYIEMDAEDFISGEASNIVYIKYNSPYTVGNSDLDYCVKEVTVPTTDREEVIYDEFLRMEGRPGDFEITEGSIPQKSNVGIYEIHYVKYNTGKEGEEETKVWNYTVDTDIPVKYGAGNVVTVTYSRLEGDDYKAYKINVELYGQCAHKESSHGNVTSPTCESFGRYDLVCDQCGEIVERGLTIPATGHNWDKGVKVSNEDSETGIGYTLYTCLNDSKHVRKDFDIKRVVITNQDIYYKNELVENIRVQKDTSVIKDDFYMEIQASLVLADGEEKLETIRVNPNNLTISGSFGNVGESWVVPSGVHNLVFKYSVYGKEYTKDFVVRGVEDYTYIITGRARYSEDNNSFVDIVVYVDDISNKLSVSERGTYKTEVGSGIHTVYIAKEELKELPSSLNDGLYCMYKVECENGFAYDVPDATETSKVWTMSMQCDTAESYANHYYYKPLIDLVGNIDDKDNRAVRGYYVYLDSLDKYEVTDSDGSWLFGGLDIGVYKLYITKLTSNASSMVDVVSSNNLLAQYDLTIDDAGSSTLSNVKTYNGVYVDEIIGRDSVRLNLTTPFSSSGSSQTNGVVSGNIKSYTSKIDCKNTLAFLDDWNTYVFTSSSGYYHFTGIPAGEHTVYFTQYDKLDGIDFKKELYSESYATLRFKVSDSGQTTYMMHSVSGIDKYSHTQQTETSGSLKFDLELGEQSTGPVIDPSIGFKVSGTLTSKNGLFANRAILLDTYDNWKIADSNGYFYFDYVESGDHILYIAQNTHSRLLAETGTVRDEEPVFLRIKLTVSGSRCTWNRAIFSKDYVSYNYTLTEPQYDEETGALISAGAVDFAINDNSDNPTILDSTNLIGSVNSENMSVTNKIVLLDTYDNWVAMNKNGDFEFKGLLEGHHNLYITKQPRSNLLNSTGEVSPDELVLAQFEFDVKSDLIVDFKVVKCDDTVYYTTSYSDSMQELTLTVNDAVAETTDEASVSGSVNSDNFDVTNRVVLLDTYNTWVSMDKSGEFTFENISEGNHSLYVTDKKKSELKAESGSIRSNESVIVRFDFSVDSKGINDLRLVESLDTVSYTYSYGSENKKNLKITVTDSEKSKEGPITVKGNISGEGTSSKYSSKAVLIDRYEHWSVTTSNGEFTFDDVEDGTHTIWVTPTKRSNLKKKSGVVSKNEPYFIKIQLVVKDSEVVSTKIIDARDDVTMSYVISSSKQEITYSIDDAAEDKENEDSDSNSNASSNGSNSGNGNSGSNSSEPSQSEIPVAFIAAYVHDGRAAKGCWMFVDDVLNAHEIPASGTRYCYVGEGVHTVYITAVDPGRIVLGNTDLTSSPYLLYQVSFENVGGKIMKVVEDKAVRNSVHNLKLSPQLNSLAVAMVTTSPLSTARSLGNTPLQSVSMTDTMTGSESSETSTTTVTNEDGSTTTTTTTKTEKENQVFSVGGKTTTSSTTVEEKETYTVGGKNPVNDKLPQTDIDYLMTVAADSGLVTLDDNANIYFNLSDAIKVSEELDTPEAIKVREDLAIIRRGIYMYIVLAIVLFGIAGFIGYRYFYKGRK